MTITANLADGRVLNFPDGTDPQVIQSTVKKMLTQQGDPAQQTQQPITQPGMNQQAQPVEQQPQQSQQQDKIAGLQQLISSGKTLTKPQQGAINELRKRGILSRPIGDTISERAKELSAQGVSDDEAKKQLLNEFWDQGQLEKDVASGEGLTPIEPVLTTKGSLVSAVKSFPESSKKQMVNLYDAISQPKQTWEGLSTILKELKDSPSPIAVSLKDDGYDVPEQYSTKEIDTPSIDMIVDDYKKTYGSYDEFKKVLASDPARVLMDIGSVVLPAAKGVQSAAIAAGLPKLAKVAGVTAKVASLTEPVSQAGAVVKPVSKLVGLPMKFLGEKLKPTKLYQDAAKMSTAINEADRIKLVQTALDEGIVPNLKGLNKMDSLITSLDDKIAKAIDTAQISNKKMPIDEIFKEFDDLEKTYKLSSKSQENIRAINRIKKSFKTTNKNLDSLTPKQAQQLKKRIYKDLRSYYESVKSSPASVEAQQAMARASKEFLEGVAPEIKNLNRKDGSVIALRNALEKPASRIQNRAILGLGAGIKTGIGTNIGYMMGSPELGILAGISFSVLTDPVVQSNIAIVVNKAMRRGVKVSSNTAKNLEKIGLKQVKKAGKMAWTSPKRLASEQMLKASQATSKKENK